MMRRNWKRVHPSSLHDALRLCKDHALEKRNCSVERKRIAELMDVTADLLYKWLSNGRMPVSSVPAYEHICGINFVSRWLAAIQQGMEGLAWHKGNVKKHLQPEFEFTEE